MMYIGPQSGRQARFLRSNADIAIYGGAAGGGKSWAMLYCPIQFRWQRYDCVVFRRTTPQILNPGGLWDESCSLYPRLGGTGRPSRLEWTWSRDQRVKLRVKFAHLEDRVTVHNWQGSQVPLICFDELTHFDEYQFWYMLSRNRSTTGTPGRMRATTNPDADSWVAKLVEWYLDSEGYPLPDRAGAVRYLVRDGNDVVWADTRAELEARYKAELVMSFSFHPALIEDNPALLRKDPAYLARLNTLPLVDRMRLRKGNWRIRATAGNVFKREWFGVVDSAPDGLEVVRYWDRAATEQKKDSHDPDWTVGVKLGRSDDGVYYVMDVARFRGTPLAVRNRILNMAQQDGTETGVGVEQDPGQAGVSEADHLVQMLDGWDVRRCPPKKSKEERAKPVSAQAESGRVKLVRGPWNDDFLRELENFPEDPHDDQVDALSGAYGMFAGRRRLLFGT